jgi:hypothetical protein
MTSGAELIDGREAAMLVRGLAKDAKRLWLIIEQQSRVATFRCSGPISLPT